MKAIVNILLFLVIIVVLAWAVGVKIFVVKPGVDQDYPDGGTLVMLSRYDMRFVDNPEAVCQRLFTGGSVCAVSIIAQVKRDGTQLLQLPYLGFLYSLSGSPAPAGTTTDKNAG